MTGIELFNKISAMTHIDPSDLRIVIDSKEIHPNREILTRWKRNCVIIVKLKLLGGCRGE